jgi:hypothetical protein
MDQYAMTLSKMITRGRVQGALPCTHSTQHRAHRPNHHPDHHHMSGTEQSKPIQYKNTQNHRPQKFSSLSGVAMKSPRGFRILIYPLWGIIFDNNTVTHATHTHTHTHTHMHTHKHTHAHTQTEWFQESGAGVPFILHSVQVGTSDSWARALSMVND